MNPPREYARSRRDPIFITQSVGKGMRPRRGRTGTPNPKARDIRPFQGPMSPLREYPTLPGSDEPSMGIPPIPKGSNIYNPITGKRNATPSGSYRYPRPES